MNANKGDSNGEKETDPRILKRYARVLMVNEHPWFFRMTGDRKDTGLVGYYGQETISNGLMVAVDTEGLTKLSKRFAFFDSIDTFSQSFLQSPCDFFRGDHYYEIVGATTPEQKPYFDIDINPNNFPVGVNPGPFAKEIVRLIIAVVRLELAKIANKPLDHAFPVSVYTTKYPIDFETKLPKKYSYHLVFQGVHFPDHEHMRRFGEHIKHYLHPPRERSRDLLMSLAAEAIDVIWFKTRQFRMLWSSKLGNDQAKEQVDEKTMEGKRIPTEPEVKLRILRESLVTLIPKNSTRLEFPESPVVNDGTAVEEPLDNEATD